MGRYEVEAWSNSEDLGGGQFVHWRIHREEDKMFILRCFLGKEFLPGRGTGRPSHYGDFKTLDEAVFEKNRYIKELKSDYHVQNRLDI